MPHLETMKRGFGAAALVLGVVEGIANELRRGNSRSVQQLADFEMLSVACEVVANAACRTPSAPKFADAWTPFAGLFEAADAATRSGGVPVQDLLGTPSGLSWRPFPVSAASLAWFGAAGLADCLKAIVRVQDVPGENRVRQLVAMLDLSAALAEAIDLGPAILAQGAVDFFFAQATAAIGAETREILAEAGSAAAILRRSLH